MFWWVRLTLSRHTPANQMLSNKQHHFLMSKGRHFLDTPLSIKWFQIYVRAFMTPPITDYGHPGKAFFKNPKLLCLGRHFGLKFFEALGVFSAKQSAPILVLWVLCQCFPLFIIQPLFLQKTKPLYPHLKYLFGIWILATKN